MYTKAVYTDTNSRGELIIPRISTLHLAALGTSIYVSKEKIVNNFVHNSYLMLSTLLKVPLTLRL